jgi:hypothetical protein
MRQNPAMMKQAAAMMENMPEEQLAAMASAMPGPPGMKVGWWGGGRGGQGGQVGQCALVGSALWWAGMPAASLQTGSLERAPAHCWLPSHSSPAAVFPHRRFVLQVDAAQMKMAAKMMATMSPADMERMTQMAAAMQGGGAAVGGMGSGGMGAMGASPALAAGGSGAAAATSTAAAAAVPDMAGMPAGFDPSNMPAGMMSDMRKRMQDPEMLKMMKVRWEGWTGCQLMRQLRWQPRGCIAAPGRTFACHSYPDYNPPPPHAALPCPALPCPAWVVAGDAQGDGPGGPV